MSPAFSATSLYASDGPEDFTWRKPSPTHVPTERECAAVRYLIEEWDYGGIIEATPGMLDWMNWPAR
jgi:hypothetical protein